MEVERSARATIRRRNSSESCPESLMNAATSHADNKMRVFSTVTVVMERPRTGGVAINCSQIFSSKFSTSAKAMSGSAWSEDRSGPAKLDIGRVKESGISTGVPAGSETEEDAGGAGGFFPIAGATSRGDSGLVRSPRPISLSDGRADAAPDDAIAAPKASSRSSRRHINCSYGWKAESWL